MSPVCLRRASFRGQAGLWALILALAPAVGAKPFPPDPVAALEQTLRRETRTDADLKRRQVNLENHARAIEGLADLRRAVMLRDWRDDELEIPLATIDGSVRLELLNRLGKGIRSQLKAAKADERLTAVILIGQMGVQVRDSEQAGGFARSFTPDLVAVMQNDKESAVREAAARNLGQINADPALAVPALQQALTRGPPGLRRAAAEGLARLPMMANSLARRGRNRVVEVTSEELVKIGLAVVPSAGKGLADDDAEVRRRCLEALTVAAQMLGDLIPDGQHADHLQGGDNNEIAAYRMEVADTLEPLLPVAAALNKELASIAGVFKDNDLTVCQAAAQAVEALGEARERWKSYAGSVPEAVRGKLVMDPFTGGMATVVPGLVRLLQQESVQVRLAALYALESLGPEAGKATADLVRALEDRDAFVRWGAARTLGNVAPQGAEQAVPKLAGRLDDVNGDVRHAAASALRHFGPAAEPAVAALARAVAHKDPTLRVPAIQAILAVGTEARPAIPALTLALADPEPDVRAAAADALGRFGADAKTALEALKKARDNSDGRVRQAANDALLRIK
jgi:HEAT repeat protein